MDGLPVLKGPLGIFDRHGNPGNCYFCNYDGGGDYDQYEPDSWPLVAYCGQTPLGNRNYVAWLCDECAHNGWTGEFRAAVIRDHDGAPDLSFVSYPGIEHEGWSTLWPDTLAAFRARFYEFEGALLRGIQLHLTRARDRTGYAEPRGVVVTIATRDRQADPDDGWVTLTLDFTMVSEFHFRGGDHDWTALSGLSISFFEDDTYLALAHAVVTRDEFYAANSFISGFRCLWATGSYTDHNITPRRGEEPNGYARHKAAGTFYDPDLF